jgi:ubiquinone/menaquinone biosynthesis C-methylase UbiE
MFLDTYVFDNSAVQATPRFQSLEVLFDARTIRFLEATSVASGWRCLEVGAGGGSIAAWMAERVGSDGHVLVTDIDPSHLTTLLASARPNLEVRRHDVAVDPLPESSFDLIHARLVLGHVPQRVEALGRLASYLAPGGSLVVEDFDPRSIDSSLTTLNLDQFNDYDIMRQAMYRVMESHGVDLEWGRSLFRRFVGLGLADVGLDGQMSVWTGASPGSRLMQANFRQVKAEAIDSGWVSDAQFNRAIEVLDDPTFAFGSPVMMTAWGRKPD